MSYFPVAWSCSPRLWHLGSRRQTGLPRPLSAGSHQKDKDDGKDKDKEKVKERGKDKDKSKDKDKNKDRPDFLEISLSRPRHKNVNKKTKIFEQVNPEDKNTT